MQVRTKKKSLLITTLSTEADVIVGNVLIGAIRWDDNTDEDTINVLLIDCDRGDRLEREIDIETLHDNPVSCGIDKDGKLININCSQTKREDSEGSAHFGDFK